MTIRKCALLLLSGLASSQAQTFNIDKYIWETTPILAPGAHYFGIADSSRTNISMREGGWSDLAQDPTDPTGNTFWTVNDRGSNVDFLSSDKSFILPNYHQKLVQFQLIGDSAKVISMRPIKDINSKYTVGLGNPLTPIAERNFLVDSLTHNIDTTQAIPADSNGYDYEGIALLNNKIYLSDEYGPFIVEIDPTTAQITKKWYPGQGIPKVFRKLRANRGMEGLTATPHGDLVGIMQSGMYNAKATAKPSDLKNKTFLNRILKLNPTTGQVQQFAYLFDNKAGTRKLGDCKVGAISAITDSTFLVIEQGTNSSGKMLWDLWKINLAQASNLNMADSTENMNNTEGLLMASGTKTLEEWAQDTVQFKNSLTPVKKELLIGDLETQLGWTLEKLEGIAILNDSTIAILNDNDYGSTALNTDGIPHLNANSNANLSHVWKVHFPSQIRLGIPHQATPITHPKKKNIQFKSTQNSLEWNTPFDHLQILNSQGKLILTLNTQNQQSTELNFGKGLFFIQATQNSQVVHSQKIILF